MALYLTVLQGTSPDTATTIFATSDPKILHAVAAAISQCLGVKKQPAEGVPTRHLAIAKKSTSTRLKEEGCRKSAAVEGSQGDREDILKIAKIKPPP